MITTIGLVLRAAGYLLGIFLILMSVYCLLWAVQSASFSVAADPMARIAYEMRVATMLPISVLSFALGALYLYVLSSRRK
ncbi:hypothetical protein JQ557_27445 [Bradyrhizobium sp. U87765 SZCCT0131]|uniref:hypothetical protein n=1 Tax=unclassified Bradyrhizobium TaxID=2631580 RepID=UPI001BA7240A|nr:MULTISPECIES: hypothetical protein [unclassified Bradyrhizobium]MBR1221765.1 hypothetical protein [Bradyrhizobium sp. U87765 SZCCT0131]MBR1264037.1 hypothetical protein [Bradyrhizobium sp. U87765 SZCCT0134]MBR1308180.1 hypothetical protein [Bradyrhizobium sp. U87765 SZCCT0110]MBR1320287.1 hypothetical protein [Bradyrhizobium sp. U87765 SZCCT0109]MBR1348600.1 hypothetical protein [Bradyrhizobium sp. U87765 SZCCT0048]